MTDQEKKIQHIQKRRLIEDSTTSGHYHYQVMPYGLSSAPSVFQCFIKDVLRDFLGRFIIVYIDDILIYFPTYKSHVTHVWQHVKLREHHLYVKGEKCEFHVMTTSFFGYIIGQEGIPMDQSKVWAFAEWPTPQTVKEHQGFLGFTNFYRRFIYDFSHITSPLTLLLKQKPKTLA